MSGSEGLFGIFSGLAPPVITRSQPVEEPRRPSVKTGTRMGGKRRHPPMLVGDVIGSWRVVALLPRLADCNERVACVCTRCGREREAYAFNLRKRDGCPWCPSRP